MTRVLFLSIGLFYCGSVIFPQVNPTSAHERWMGIERKEELEKSSLVNAIPFRSIGPSIMGGRVVDLDVNPDDPTEFYLAYATGGVWYTHNNGQSFVPITDSLPVISIGDIAVNWKRKEVWIGSGDPNPTGDVLPGFGIYRTKDNGKTWEHLGLPESQHVGKIILHPTNSAVAWVAVMGQLRQPNRERGVYKTADGGKSWKKVLYINDSTGVIDMAINPKNPNIIFAASWTLIKPPGRASRFCGDGSGIYKTKDGGRTWALLTTGKSGFITGNKVGRIGLDIYSPNPSIIYAVVDNRDLIPVNAKNASERKRIIGAEVYRSINGGKSWTRQNDELLDIYASYGWFFGKINVSPINEKKLIIGGAAMQLSDDGGRTFSGDHSGLIYADHHAAWINPKNDDHIIVGNDGGCNISYDNGKNSFKVNTPGAGQFYSVSVDYSTMLPHAYFVYGGLQDHGLWMGPSNVDGGSSTEWLQDGDNPYKPLLSGADGYQIQVDTTTNTTYYLGMTGGIYSRQELQSAMGMGITVYDSSLRRNWESPLILSKHNQDIVYYGANKLFLSMHRGDKFVAISPDLTKGKVEGIRSAGTLTTITESPLKFGLLYTGSDDGMMYCTKDGGNNWKLISNGRKEGTLLPQGLKITRMVASRFKESRVYATMSGSYYDDFKAYVFVSEDHGETWKSISNDLPCESVYVLKEDPTNERLLYIGTQGGIYVSMNGGDSWMAWVAGLPRSVPVRDIAIQERENEIVLGTYGRSLYVGRLAGVQGVAKDPDWLKKHPEDLKFIVSNRSPMEEEEDEAKPEY